MPDTSPRNVTSKGGNSGRAGLRLLGAALVVAGLAVPGPARAGDAASPGGLGVLLASASNLTNSEMAAQTGSGLHIAAPVPELQQLHPKVRLWDELVPTISAAMQNQTTTVTVRTGP